MAKKRHHRCKRCGEKNADVMRCGTRWHVGGDHIGHLEWSKDDSPLYLCDDCEQEFGDEYRSCAECGDYVSIDSPYPLDEDGEPLCPACEEKAVGSEK